MTTQIKAIILISLSLIGYLIQMYFQEQGSQTYNAFLALYTISPYSRPEGFIISAFLHGNLLHLGMNMVALYGLSTMFPKKNSKFIRIYLISLLLASLFSYLYVNFIEPSYVLGASGAIFGIFGYIFFKYNKRQEFFLNFLIFNVGMLFLGMPIAWYAHLGGSIAGILYYYYENDIIPKIKRNKMKRI